MATTPWDDTPPTVGEVYETACNTSNLTVHGGMVPEGSASKAGDIVWAAGMVGADPRGAGRLGMALLRLHSEWTAAPKPHKPSKDMLEAMAHTIKTEDAQAQDARAKANGQLAHLKALQAKHPNFDRLVEIGQLEALYQKGDLPLPEIVRGQVQERAQKRAQQWYASELRMLAGRLKSKPEVSGGLHLWAAIKGIPADTVAEALHYWLDSTCHECDGHGLLKHHAQPALSAKQCRKCYGTGNAPKPDGVGRVLAHIEYALGIARSSIKHRLRG